MAPILSIFFLNLLVSTFAGQTKKIILDTRVSSVETVYGDVYDCIDVYKQPSLAHPALRHHEVKMTPGESVATSPYGRNASKKSAHRNQNLWKSKKACPQGTVPIRRTTLEDQKIMKNSSRDDLVQSLKYSGGVDFAGIVATRKKFYGAEATINLQNPKVFSNQDYSSAIISVESGASSDLNQIIVGWTVNPRLYGDSRTRFFTAWTRDNFASTGCFNSRCPGFINANSNIVPFEDYAFPYTSISGGKQYEVVLYVTWDPKLGWWLLINGESVGYWPLSLFTGLQSNADTIRFGGQVLTSNSDVDSPQMGSGVFINGQYDLTCYMRRLVVIDDTKKPIDVDNSFVNEVDSRCYFAGDNSYKDDRNGYSFNFGGKGGKDGSTCIY